MASEKKEVIQYLATQAFLTIMPLPELTQCINLVLLQICGVSNPLQLWLNHRQELAEDYKHQVRQQNPNIVVDYNDAIVNMARSAIEDIVLSLGGGELQAFGLTNIQQTQVT